MYIQRVYGVETGSFVVACSSGALYRVHPTQGGLCQEFATRKKTAASGYINIAWSYISSVKVCICIY